MHQNLNIAKYDNRSLTLSITNRDIHRDTRNTNYENIVYITLYKPQCLYTAACGLPEHENS